MVSPLASISRFERFQCSDCSSTVPPVAFSNCATTRPRTISSNAGLRKNHPIATTRSAKSPAITTQSHHGKRDNRTFSFSAMLVSAPCLTSAGRTPHRQRHRAVNLRLLPQVVQPCIEQLVDVLLHQ